MERKIRIVNEYGTFSAIEINKAYVECREYIKHYREVIAKQEKQISELESELAVKENLLKIKNGLCDEESLPFSSDEYKEDFLEELRSRDLNFNLVFKMLDVIELMLTDTQN